MRNLLAFESNTSSDFSLKADLVRSGNECILQFELIDTKSLFELAKPFQAFGEKTAREDGLWNDTCFEMFLKPQDSEIYYEFNFSLKPAWNEYKFQAYRQPQPAQSSNDIQFKQMQWDGRKLLINLMLENSKTNFDVGLTAVLKEKSGLKHYMALVHTGEKPDFHLAKSFVVKI